jgi:hypothetical protein
MKESEVDVFAGKDRFTVAQVALYVFSVLQIVITLGAVFGAYQVDSGSEVSALQRLSAIVRVTVDLGCFAVGYMLLGKCLVRCTVFVWRIAFGVFLLHICVTALAVAARPGPLLILILLLSSAGAFSVWNGRQSVGKCFD